MIAFAKNPHHQPEREDLGILSQKDVEDYVQGKASAEMTLIIRHMEENHPLFAYMVHKIRSELKQINENPPQP